MATQPDGRRGALLRAYDKATGKDAGAVHAGAADRVADDLYAGANITVAIGPATGELRRSSAGPAGWLELALADAHCREHGPTFRWGENVRLKLDATGIKSRMRFTPPQPASSSIIAMLIGALAQERDRAKSRINKWNCRDLPSDAAWRRQGQADLGSLAQFKGKLGSSAATLAGALEKMSALDKELSRLYVYASMLSDQDTRDATHRGMQQEMVQIASGFSAQASFIEPEILKLPNGTIDRFIASEPRLKIYSFYLKDIAWRASHTLTENEEKILADADRWPVPATPRYPRTQIFRTRRHTQRRPDGEAGSGGVHRSAGAAEPRRSREGDVRLLHCPRQLRPHLRHDDERGSAEGAVLREAEVPDRARNGAGRSEHPRPFTRGWLTRQPQPADVPPLSRCASRCSASISCTTTISTRRSSVPQPRVLA